LTTSQKPSIIAAKRFEIWFTPNAGGPDRKLMEKVFKIEGWQR
jgi:hypothetical protein